MYWTLYEHHNGRWMPYPREPFRWTTSTWYST